MPDAINIALHYLKFRPRSVEEVRRKLSTKCEEKEINQVISVLKKNQLLDDEKFAKMWISDRNLLKPTGSYLLKLELKKLGISDEIIENSLKDQDEEKLAQDALASKSRLENADFQKKASFLQRRGFGIGIIYKIQNPKSK